MLRSTIFCLLIAGLTAGCASTERVTSGGYYCTMGTEMPCASHEGSGDCQPCPHGVAQPSTAAAMSADPAIVAVRRD